MPTSLADLLKWGRGTLKNAGIDDFDISAELLLRSVLGLSRSQLLLNPALGISSDNEIEYKRLTEDRARHVPLQYLTGQVDFYNIVLKTDSRALIPRPETEILVETVIGKLQSFKSPKILDVGTGTGNIAIALAKNIETCSVSGIDISSDALELARLNADLNQVETRVRFFEGDILDAQFATTLGQFDCVVSNPPYIANRDRGKLQPEIIEHEPQVALFSGDDPLKFFKTIIASVSYILVQGGVLAFEVGMGQAVEIGDFMRSDFREIEITKDLSGIERVVSGIYAGLN